MKKIGFVITCHWSEKIRPNGNELLKKFYTTLYEYCKYPFQLYIVDNQSEFNLDIPSYPNIEVIRIENQYEKGLTGAWNIGLLHAYQDKCDILINCNDDLFFNESLNKFIQYIDLDNNENIIYSALTNGVLGGKQFANAASDGIINLDCKTDNSVVNGFFFGFTSDHYKKYRYSITEYFPIEHSHNGNDGKWGGQEGYWIEKSKFGLSGIIIKEAFISHIKLRAWKTAKHIENENK